MLDVVKIGEFPAVIGGGVLLELGHGLPTKGVPVHKEEDSSGICELDQTVHGAYSHEGLATAGCHLDQGPGFGISKGDVEVSDCLDLAVSQTGGDQFGKLLESAPDGLIILCPLQQGLRSVECEDPSGSCIGVFQTPEEGLDPRTLICKGERVLEAGDVGREGEDVFVRLVLGTGEGGPLRFCLDDTGSLPVNEQEVVCKAG